MQVNNNLNTMMQLEKRLEESANELSKLNLDNQQTDNKKQQEMKKEVTIEKELPKDVDVAKELVKQIEIPIAYTANAEVISTQNSTTKTLLDIKA